MNITCCFNKSSESSYGYFCSKLSTNLFCFATSTIRHEHQGFVCTCLICSSQDLSVVGIAGDTGKVVFAGRKLDQHIHGRASLVVEKKIVSKLKRFACRGKTTAMFLAFWTNISYELKNCFECILYKTVIIIEYWH